MSRMLVAIATLGLLAAGCASRGSLKQTQLEVTGLRTEVAALQHSHEVHLREIARLAAELRTLEGRNAELQTTLREQSAEAARLRARLDASEQELREAKAPAPAEASNSAKAPAPAQTSNSAKAPTHTSDSKAPAPAQASNPATPREGAAAPDEARREYDAGMANFRAREHGQAVLDFMDFVGKYPQHPLAPSAQYWIGEAYFVQRDYRQALVEFGRAVDMAPSSSTAADALLKIGLAHTNLRENSRAQQVWQRVVQDYPASESAGKARALLREHAARRP